MVETHQFVVGIDQLVVDIGPQETHTDSDHMEDRFRNQTEKDCPDTPLGRFQNG